MAVAILRPDAIGFYDEVPLSAGSSKVAAVDPGPNVVHDGDASYLSTTAWLAVKRQTFKIRADSIPPDIGVINELRLFIRVAEQDNGTTTPTYLYGFTRLGGVDGPTNGGFQVPSYWPPNWHTIPSDKAAVGRAGGTALAAADITTALEIGLYAPTDANGYWFGITSLWAELDYEALGSGLEGFRQIGSKRLRLRRLPNGLIEARGLPMACLDAEMLDLASLSHLLLPGAGARGAGVKTWERWPCSVMSSSLDWNSGTVTLLLRDDRDVLCTYWDVGKSLKAPGAISDGVARLDGGNARLWLRTSKAWVRTPGDTLLEQSISADKIDKAGTLIEGASTNLVIQGGFKNGAADAYTGWTTAGKGSNGSNISDDASELLFDAESTDVARSVKFTGGTPSHAADLEVVATATASVAANANCRVSIWHKDDSGSPLYWALQRGVDSKWFRDSDQTWQASKTWNALTVRSSRERDYSSVVAVGVGATTLTLRVGIPTPGIAGQVNHLYHVQVEAQKWPSSAILTEASAVTRALDRLTISNAPTLPAWPNERGTFSCRVVLNWNASESGSPGIVSVVFGPDDAWWFLYDTPNARWWFAAKSAGVWSSPATFAASPVARTEYRLAVRWTSSDGELGLANTLSVFVDGVKGVDVSGVAKPRQSNVGVMTLGAWYDPTLAADPSLHLEGAISAIEIVPRVLSDEEIARR